MRQSYYCARIYNQERYAVEECRSGGSIEASEQDLLVGFWRTFERDKPRVVTWNGRGFDMPVLVQRAFVYGIPASYWHQAGDRWTGYRQRYAAESHCDLMDALADNGASKALKLDEAALAMGLPGKIGGHGSEVRDMAVIRREASWPFGGGTRRRTGHLRHHGGDDVC